MTDSVQGVLAQELLQLKKRVLDLEARTKSLFMKRRQALLMELAALEEYLEIARSVPKHDERKVSQ